MKQFRSKKVSKERTGSNKMKKAESVSEEVFSLRIFLQVIIMMVLVYAKKETNKSLVFRVLICSLYERKILKLNRKEIKHSNQKL